MSVWPWGRRSKMLWATRRVFAASAKPSCPLDETLAKVVVDLSGRPYLSYNVKIRPGRVGDFDTDLPMSFSLRSPISWA